MRKDPSYWEVLAVEDSLPLDAVARRYWLVNQRNPLRKVVLPTTRAISSLLLFAVYFIKRLIPLQFSAHRTLQGVICFFLKWFVTPEAVFLILRHMWTESNIINFIIRNSRHRDAPLVTQYPEMIRDLMTDTFVEHDILLMNAILDLGPTQDEPWPVPRERLDWSGVRPIAVRYDILHRKPTQFIDFETAHELFKVLFCLLLRADEYERAINSLNLDQTLALRVARIMDEPWVGQMAFNGFPLALVGPMALGRRFTLHGLFTEHLHAYLEQAQAQCSR